MNRWFPALALAAILLSAACQPLSTNEGVARDTPVLTLATHDSFSVSEEVLHAFEAENDVTLRILTLGDAGEALNKIILSKDAPLADVFFGVDNTFLGRALEADVFAPYSLPLPPEIPDDLRLDEQNRLLPVDFGYVTINADKEWFSDAGIPLPQALEDLADPAYKDLLVVENPATSSPGLAFLLATIGHFGEGAYLDYWRALRANGVAVTSGWSEAYFEYFTVGSAGVGERPLVVSYSTSPPADVVYATDGRTEPASVNLLLPDSAFRQIEFAGILKGAKHPELAEALVDYMLRLEFQEDIPLQMFVYPAHTSAALPDLFVEFGQTPDDPVLLSPDEIEASREQWINNWTDVMLR